MKGYQAAIAVLAVLLVVTAGALFYLLADRGGASEAQAARAPAVSAYAPPSQLTAPQQTTPTPARSGAVVDDEAECEREDDEFGEEGYHEIDPEDFFDICSSCGGECLILCGYCGGDGIMPYPCPRCGGDGIRPCPHCGGIGVEPD